MVEDQTASVPRHQDSSGSEDMDAILDSEPYRKGIPGFVTKLYRMVSEGTSNLIKWSQDGNSFIVTNPEEFARQVLPAFFKHNNFSSFVRQLNMYGFHKVPHLHQGTLLASGVGAVGGRSPSVDVSNEWEFENENFKRKRFDLLLNVKRRVATQEESTAITSTVDSAALTAAKARGTPSGGTVQPMSMEALVSEIGKLTAQQEALRTDISAVQRENQMLWNETLAARERHLHQQQVVEKILKFLAQVFSTDKNLNAAAAAAGINIAKRQLLLEDSPAGASSSFSRSIYLPPHNPESFGNRQPADRIYDAPTGYDCSRIMNFIDTANSVGNDIDALQRHLNIENLPYTDDCLFPPPATTADVCPLEERSLVPSPKKARSSPIPEDGLYDGKQDFDISRFLVDDDQIE